MSYLKSLNIISDLVVEYHLFPLLIIKVTLLKQI